MRNTLIVLFSCWFVVNVTMALMASFSKRWYSHRNLSSLGMIEIKIMDGDATLKDRIMCFGFNMMGGIVAPPIYALALALYFVVLMVKGIILVLV